MKCNKKTYESVGFVTLKEPKKCKLSAKYFFFDKEERIIHMRCKHHFDENFEDEPISVEYANGNKWWFVKFTSLTRKEVKAIQVLES